MRPLALTVLAFLVACKGGGGAAPTNAAPGINDLNGTWEGSAYSDVVGRSLPVHMVLVGNNEAGYVAHGTISGSTCFANFQGVLTYDGMAHLVFRTANGLGLDGTVSIGSTGAVIQGPYSVDATSACGPDHGSASLARVSTSTATLLYTEIVTFPDITIGIEVRGVRR